MAAVAVRFGAIVARVGVNDLWPATHAGNMDFMRVETAHFSISAQPGGWFIPRENLQWVAKVSLCIIARIHHLL